jgi:phosphate starvation-inducible PhoH-like protein|tara:strand:+ start:3710 stop:4870 length:1161 start_codon:yes stop_codon:yes gene_type:complete
LKRSDNQPSASTLTLEPNDARRLAALCGQFDENIRLIEQRLDVDIRSRDNFFAAYGDLAAANQATAVIYNLYQQTAHYAELSPEEVHLNLRQSQPQPEQQSEEQPSNKHSRQHSRQQTNSTGTPSRKEASFMQTPPLSSPKPKNSPKLENSPRPASGPEPIENAENFSVIRTKKGNIKPRGINQQRYVRAIQTHDVNFGIGPAGTGKTYLAVACAVEALLRDEVERILLVRPAVEAGERLGFLPGDLAQKVDPYLRPLYDALHEMLGFETVAKLQERNVIEIAPLAYMRGRTLNGAYILLDEAQNTTREQMKMFLTRIGFGSTAVITGDMSQVDLPRGVNSGLVHACEVLQDVQEVSFTHFISRDVVRHPIVQSIVDAYDAHEKTE